MCVEGKDQQVRPALEREKKKERKKEGREEEEEQKERVDGGNKTPRMMTAWVV